MLTGLLCCVLNAVQAPDQYCCGEIQWYFEEYTDNILDGLQGWLWRNFTIPLLAYQELPIYYYGLALIFGQRIKEPMLYAIWQLVGIW